MLVTSVVRKRIPLFCSDAHAQEAIETLFRVQEFYPFFLYGFVFMPDHCHLLLHIPEGGSVSKIMNIYKGIFSANVGLGPLWQKRFHIRLQPNIPRTLRYIHMNPVRLGLCEFPEKYPWSSASGKWDVADPDVLD